MFDFTAHFVIVSFVTIFLINYAEKTSISKVLMKTVADNNNGEIYQRKFQDIAILKSTFDESLK